MSNDVVYVSQVKIERVKGPIRRAWLPAEKEPIVFGVHSEVAQHYKVDPAKVEPHATTLDYLVAAAPADSRGPSAARWRRAVYRHRKGGSGLRRGVKSRPKAVCSS